MKSNDESEIDIVVSGASKPLKLLSRGKKKKKNGELHLLAAQKENFESINTSVCLNSDTLTSFTAISGVSFSKERRKKKSEPKKFR